MVWFDTSDLHYMHERQKERDDSLMRSGTKEDAVASTDGGEILFDPCLMTFHYPPEPKIVRLANLPASALTEWRLVCPANWSLSGIMHGSGWPPTPTTIAAQQRVDLVFGLLIAFQWFLVGGFPLNQPKRWWWEPGAFITACSIAAFVLVLIPGIRELSQLPALLAGLGWLYWLGLLVWVSLRSGWRSVLRNRVQEP